MASITINTSDFVADGTTLSVYLRSAWGVESTAGAPSGSAVTTGVTSAGTVTFSGLNDGTSYLAYDSGSGKKRLFSTPPVSAASSSGASGTVDGIATPVQVVDTVTATTTWGGVRWAEPKRRKLVIANIGTATLDIGLGDYTQNTPAGVLTSIAPGVEWIERFGQVSVFVKAQSGTGTFSYDVTIEGS